VEASSETDSKLLLCFAENTDVGSVYHEELLGFMRAIKLAAHIGII